MHAGKSLIDKHLHDADRIYIWMPFWKAIWQDVPEALKESAIFDVVFSHVGICWYDKIKKKKEKCKRMFIYKNQTCGNDFTI